MLLLNRLASTSALIGILLLTPALPTMANEAC